MFETALRYGAMYGLHVFPVQGKQPATRRGLLDASTDPDKIKWFGWQDNPNWGIAVACGPSGLVIPDLDQPHGPENFKQIVQAHGRLPETVVSRTPSGGWHPWFAYQGTDIRPGVGVLGPGIDVRAGNSYIVTPPSPGYTWAHALEQYDIAPLPDWLLEAILDAQKQRRRTKGLGDPESTIPQGQRNQTLFREGCALRNRGYSQSDILAALTKLNRDRCKPDPLPPDELERIAEQAAKYEPDQQIGTAPPPPAPAGMGAGVAGVVDVFRKWLYLPDLGPLYVTLASVLANRMPGDPVWTMLIAPPGAGKTEILQSCAALPGCHSTATLTEPALLSGTPKKDAAQGASGGILRAVGSSGVLIVKDFGSILSMRSEERARTMAALREVYDGSWTRSVGTDGGKQLHWAGKLGMIAGATPAIDEHYTAMAALGDRFCYYRFDTHDRDLQGTRSLAHGHDQGAMRDELKGAVAALFERIPRETPSSSLQGNEIDRLVALANFITLARSPVVRDWRTREIEFVPGAEAPGRFVAVLYRLLDALRLLGVPENEIWAVLCRVSGDSMPAARLEAFAFLDTQEGSCTTTEISTALGLPSTTTRRVLQDLNAYNVVARVFQGVGRPDLWTPTSYASNLYERAFQDNKPDLSRKVRPDYGGEESVEQEELQGAFPEST